MKWGDVDTGVPGDGCEACAVAFVPSDDVRVCAECETYIHTKCFLKHLGGCDRRRN